MSTTIREAAHEDAEAVLVLAKPFVTSFVVEEQAFHHAFGELLVQADAFLAVAERQGQVVGYVLGFDHYTFYANGRVAWVEELMVGQASRRQGVDAGFRGVVCVPRLPTRGTGHAAGGGLLPSDRV